MSPPKFGRASNSATTVFADKFKKFSGHIHDWGAPDFVVSNMLWIEFRRDVTAVATKSDPFLSKMARNCCNRRFVSSLLDQIRVSAMKVFN